MEDLGELAQALPLYQSAALYAVMQELERAVADGATYLLDVWDHTDELRASRMAVSTSVPVPGEQDYRGLLSAVYKALATCNTAYMARTTVERFAHGFFQDTVQTSFAHTLLAWLFIRLTQGAFVSGPTSQRADADRVSALDASVSVGDPVVMEAFTYYRRWLLDDDAKRKQSKQDWRTLGAKNARVARVPERIAWDRLDAYCRYIAAQYVYSRTPTAERDEQKRLRAVKREHARHHAAMRRANKAQRA